MIAKFFVDFSEKLNFNKATRSKLQINWDMFFKLWWLMSEFGMFTSQTEKTEDGQISIQVY